MANITAAEATRRSLWQELNPDGDCRICGHGREAHTIHTDLPHQMIEMSKEQAEALSPRAMRQIHYGLDAEGKLAYLRRRNLSQNRVVFATICTECGPDENGSYHHCYSRGHAGLTP